VTQLTKEQWDKGMRPTYGLDPEGIEKKTKKRTAEKQPDSEEE